MLVKTVFMLKPLEARSKKTFGDAAWGGLVIYEVNIFFLPAMAGLSVKL